MSRTHHGEGIISPINGVGKTVNPHAKDRIR
jgi:hypothetical protein